MNRSDLEQSLVKLTETLKSIDNFTENNNLHINSNDTAEILAFKGVIFSIIMLLALLSNILVLVVLFSANSFQQSSSFFFASLCLSDLGITIFVMLPSAVQELSQSWVMGSLLCQLHISLDVTLCTVSILHLGIISHDRYTAIVSRPLRYKSKATISRHLALVAGCWLVGILVGFVPVMSGLYTTQEHLTWALRHPERCEFHVNKTFSVIAPIVSFLLPTLVMIYSYIRVYLETRRLERQPLVTRCSLNLFQENIPGKEALKAEDEDTGEKEYPDIIIITSNDIQPIEQLSEKKTEVSAAKKLFLVMVGFLICWLPYFLWLPFSTLLSLETPGGVYTVILWIGYLNSALNPLLYVLILRDSKKCLSRKYGLLRGCCPCLKTSNSDIRYLYGK